MCEWVRIRPAQRQDRSAILTTVRAAFTSSAHDAQEEVDIVEAIWHRQAEVSEVDLVAVCNGEVVGQVLGSWGDLSGSSVVGVAPLAVEPIHQGIGVGTLLMSDMIRRGECLALPLFVLLGDPGYYERFGFESAERFGIWYEPAGRGNPHFMVRQLSAHSGFRGGQYRYAWEL